MVEDLEKLKLPFLEEMRLRVVNDFDEAKSFLGEIHARWAKARDAYYSSYKYQSLREKNCFPMPLMQEMCDQYVAHQREKLWFANRPCTVVGVEDTDKADAAAKQDLMHWQDYTDKLSTKTQEWLRDAFLYGVCVGQVNYDEEYRKAQTVTQVEKELPQSWLRETMGIPPQVVTEEVYGYEDVVAYKGPRVNRVDPFDIFYGPDKREINDEFPIMVRSDQTREFFFSKPYFTNQKELNYKAPDNAKRDNARAELLGEEQSTVTLTHEYVEWQGLIQRKKIYKHKKQEIPEGTNEHDYVWCICGVVDGATVVRLDTQPLCPFTDAAGPNIVFGTSIKADSFHGDSIAQKILPMHIGSEQIMGMLLENLKQSVNAMHVINKRMIIGNKTKINQAGGILLTNDDVSKVHKRIEQPPIAPDLYKLIGIFRQWAQDASGLQDSTLGKADASVETLGEANMIDAKASLRMRDYLKSFEDTFIIPIYAMRNQVNMDFLDQEYVYGIVGESAIEWRTITPQQIRAHVDFICEASTRESNRAVQTQQMLEMIQLAPAAMSAGQPVRIDKMIFDLAEIGFSMKKPDIERYFPLIAAEKQGLNIDPLYVQMALMQLGGMGAMGGGGMAPPPGQELPQPKTEVDAITQANQKQGVQI